MPDHQRAAAYDGTALACLAFGLLGLASIGFPLLLVWVVIPAVGPVRRRRDVRLPPPIAIAPHTALLRRAER